MKIHSLALWLAIIVTAFSPAGFAQEKTSALTNMAHPYTAYEKLILKNVSQFHKNFNARLWDKNGELVPDDACEFKWSGIDWP